MIDDINEPISEEQRGNTKMLGLCKAKHYKENRWLVGDLIDYGTHKAIRLGDRAQNIIQIAPNTLCEFTGLTLAKGNEVFEGTIAFEEIQIPEGEGPDIRMFYVCTWIKEWMAFAWLDYVEHMEYEKVGADVLDMRMLEMFERTPKTSSFHYAGNYIDNPELLNKF